MTKDRLGQHQKDILRIIFWLYDKPLHSRDIRDRLLFCSFQQYYNSMQKLIERGLVTQTEFKSFELTDKGLWECIRRGRVI